MKNKFKVGDIVTCKRKYSDEYEVTKHGVMCEVIEPYDNYGIMVKILSDIPQKDEKYTVYVSHFKLYLPMFKPGDSTISKDKRNITAIGNSVNCDVGLSHDIFTNAINNYNMELYNVHIKIDTDNKIVIISRDKCLDEDHRKWLEE